VTLPDARAPGFSLPLAGGGVLRFPEDIGRPALLAFYKDDCPTCRFTFPFLQRLHAQAGKAILVAGISQDTVDRARSWAADLGLDFPIAVDAPDYPVSRRYALRAVPTLVGVDAAGRVVAVEEGFRKEALRDLAGRLAGLAGAPAPVLYREGEEIPALKPG
jgi:peroxiredoxin